MVVCVTIKRRNGCHSWGVFQRVYTVTHTKWKGLNGCFLCHSNPNYTLFKNPLADSEPRAVCRPTVNACLWFFSFRTISVLRTVHYHRLSCSTLNAFSLSRKVITALTAFWQLVSPSVLSLLTWGVGCSASEHIPKETWDEMLFHDEKKSPLVDFGPGLYITPVFLQKKCVYVSQAQFVVVEYAAASFQQFLKPETFFTQEWCSVDPRSNNSLKFEHTAPYFTHSWISAP